jgi:hypothetical protein
MKNEVACLKDTIKFLGLQVARLSYAMENAEGNTRIPPKDMYISCFLARVDDLLQGEEDEA